MIASGITSGYVGTVGISALYAGSVKIWPPSQPVPSEQYLTFDIVSSGTIGLSNVGSAPSVTVQYSLNNGAWTNLSNSTINVSAGDTIRWRGTNTRYSSDRDKYNHFSGTALFNIKGNIVSLIYGDDFEGKESYTLQDYALNCIFLGSKCVDAYDLYIYTNTGMRSLRHTFATCTSLIRPPKAISGQDMGTFGLGAMFNGCTSVQFLPDFSNFIPNTSSLQECFRDCKAVKEAPAFYSGATPVSAYQNAFLGCSGLESAVLPSETLSNRSYYRMFSGCTSLKYIELNALTGNTGSTSDSSFYQWVGGVPTGGTIVKRCELNLPSGSNGIPNGWTVVDDCPEPPVPTGETKYRITSVANATFSDGDKIVMIEPNSKKIITGIGRGSTSFSAFTGEGLYDELPAGTTVLVYYSGHLEYENGSCANSEPVVQSSYSSIARFIMDCSVGTRPVGLLTTGNYKGRLLTDVPQYGGIGLYLADNTSGYNYPHFQYGTTSPYFYGYKLTEEPV